MEEWRLGTRHRGGQTWEDKRWAHAGTGDPTAINSSSAVS